VRNTVGFFNRKYFFLSITHSVSCLVCYLIVLAPYMVDSVNALGNALNVFILLAWVVALVEVILLLVFWSFHIFLTVNAFTTIEFREKHKASESKVTLHGGEKVRDLYKESLYNVSVLESFRQLLGPYMVLWLIPTRFAMSQDGTSYPVRSDHPILISAENSTREMEVA
jgi:hypothetical protein